ncbi:deoxyuridine 5'-triphosphate nucleotidohydrolase [Plasmodium brasilianum]|uniref:Deoxyuridine 5'-triphosphate nucleotidohydrolase n=2 Tax=Plasmodium (Plasmodium) TaxID=418103 RepID=A0A1A8X9E2_PLAMA|nr:deoxyuridine 5'-triphosphate nucleotidohydrolase, putative [Plasmodium malariae]KAI4838394.1 deoxyuridine 5'-triphosphate nucleotidohydrolase [Plasmodium brasilianum]SBT00883.1 deoxyuridine 5'-triphosphate nucleotidohydrolase (dUTPase) [Plasmodium malariae]SCN12790.1 deoxyuridine 5'-triphosphate nucleotidohydrolase, putative [Plasmodium malariae]
MHLKIMCINNEVREMYKNHKAYHEGDSGLDLFVIKDEVLKPKATTFVKLGIKVIALQYKYNYYYKCNKNSNSNNGNNCNNSSNCNNCSKNENSGNNNNNIPEIVNTSFLLFPRSSISKTPLRLANSIGLIDAGYRGEIIAALDNTSNEEYVIKKNDKLVQLVSFTGEPLSFELVDELDETSRGEGGFGSTSNKKN